MYRVFLRENAAPGCRGIRSLPAVTHGHCSSRSVASNTNAANDLFYPKTQYTFRPILKKDPLSRRTAVIDPKSIDQINQQREMREIFRYNELRMGAGWDRLLRRLRHGAIGGSLCNFSPDREARAILACAKEKPLGYDTIYYNVDVIADALFIAGRLELEQPATHRPLAQYMLNIAVELGQLDAALLLHKLELHNTSIVASQSARKLIQRASDQKDWRSMLALHEHQSGVHKGGRPDWPAIVKTVRTLLNVTTLYDQDSTMSASQRDVKAHKRFGRGLASWTDKEGRIFNVDAIELFSPPVRHLWQFCRDNQTTLIANPDRDGVQLAYARALAEDAEDNADPEAMWQIIKLSDKPEIPIQITRQREWGTYLNEAVTFGVPAAQLNYGLHRLKEAGYYPTLQMKDGKVAPGTLSLINRNSMESIFKDLSSFTNLEPDCPPSTIACIYLFMAGVISGNGGHDEALQMIKLAIPQVAAAKITAKCNIVTKQSYLGLLKDFESNWHKYRNSGLPEDYSAKSFLENPDFAQYVVPHYSSDRSRT